MGNGGFWAEALVKFFTIIRAREKLPRKLNPTWQAPTEGGIVGPMPRHRPRYTLFLTRTGGKSLGLELTPLAVGLLLLFLGGLLGLGAYLGYKAASLRPLERRLEALSEETRRLSLALEEERRKNGALSQKARETEEELRKLKEAIEELRRRAGLPPKSVRPARLEPQGGPGLPAGEGPSWALLKEEVLGLRRELEGVQPALERTLAREAARPRGLPLPYFRELSSHFGLRKNPFGRGSEFHDGLDFSAPYGAPVRATAPGVVVRAGWMGAYGLAVQVDHGYGYQTLYGHLSRLEVRPGERVQRGQVLGRVGSTGRSTGPHLHYTVFQGGVAVDPSAYIKE